MSNTQELPERSSDKARDSLYDIRDSLYDIQEGHADSDIPAVTNTTELDPFLDEHDIEYWIWDGTALIPASPGESERFREREARRRLTYWQTHVGGSDHARPRRWHTIVTVAQSALGKLHARLSGHNI